MNLFKITLYSVLKKDFFDLFYNICCDAREYVGCTNVDRYFDIESVEREELVDIGLGVRVSRPVVVERGLIGGKEIFSSLSHNGVLAIHCHTSEYMYQLTDLVNGRQIEIVVKNWTHTGFYDDSMVMLTYCKLIGVCSVEEMFLKKNVNVLKRIGDVKVDPFTDVSFLHSTRVLVFGSPDVLYEFNVDSSVIKQLNVGKRVSPFASLTGVDVGVKGVFLEIGNKYFTYSLNSNNSTSLVLECCPGLLCTFIPSSSHPGDLKKGIKIYHNGNFFTSAMYGAQLTTPFKHQEWRSIVRLYQDIFLVFDTNTKKWCLVKIIVP